MNDLYDPYDKKNRKPLWLLGSLGALMTVAAGLVTILSESGLLQVNSKSPPPVVIVSMGTPAPPAAPQPNSQVAAVPPAVPRPSVPPPTAQRVAPTPTMPLAARSMTDNGVSDQIAQSVEDFWIGAVAAEILAYTYGDASYAALFMAGDTQQSLEDDLAYLNNRGLSMVPAFDTDRSYIADIRVIRDTQIEVDTCEVWAAKYYRLLDGAYVRSRPAGACPANNHYQAPRCGLVHHKH